MFITTSVACAHAAVPSASMPLSSAPDGHATAFALSEREMLNNVASARYMAGLGYQLFRGLASHDHARIRAAIRAMNRETAWLGAQPRPNMTAALTPAEREIMLRGAMQMKQGHTAAAIAIFNQELERFPDSNVATVLLIKAYATPGPAQDLDRSAALGWHLASVSPRSGVMWSAILWGMNTPDNIGNALGAYAVMMYYMPAAQRTEIGTSMELGRNLSYTPVDLLLPDMPVFEAPRREEAPTDDPAMAFTLAKARGPALAAPAGLEQQEAALTLEYDIDAAGIPRNARVSRLSGNARFRLQALDWLGQQTFPLLVGDPTHHDHQRAELYFAPRTAMVLPVL
ncbi:hypothetical protein [Komagataeibacter xylinus]|uniref:Tetratricopeptide repeat protein n=1 Tax=Komagataeibacter xylinus TaxID=28448 RepID=A0A857FPQ7_KOMXY|nr:hypothetical protein [Komagataeibacter xylinus]QHC35217.1 hypothetical protein FMA36_06625 [Komagataeibacter xylinus]